MAETGRSDEGRPFVWGRVMGERLTGREREVIKAILAGVTTNQGIADRLVVEERTVRTYINNIYGKTGAINKVELVLMCLGRVPAPSWLREQIGEGGEGDGGD